MSVSVCLVDNVYIMSGYVRNHCSQNLNYSGLADVFLEKS